MAGSTARRIGVLLTTGALAFSLAGTVQPSSGSAPSKASAPHTDPCRTRGPIQAAELSQGVHNARCSLVGRVVVSGDAAVVVPPEGFGVGADGVDAAGSGGSPSLQVSNVGGAVSASVDDSASRQISARATSACNAGKFALESGRHPWGGKLRWKYHRASEPDRFPGTQALGQIKAGMTNLRLAQNDCGLKPRLGARAAYVGKSANGPKIKVKGDRITCGKFDRSNIVGWGSLPDGLLGWTCYWWGSNQKMIGADMRLSRSTSVVTKFPSACSQRYDLQSLATHEWGHAWGLGHVSNPNLTMHHFLPPCSAAFRTLGLGDVKGMRKLYG